MLRPVGTRYDTIFRYIPYDISIRYLYCTLYQNVNFRYDIHHVLMVLWFAMCVDMHDILIRYTTDVIIGTFDAIPISAVRTLRVVKKLQLQTAVLTDPNGECKRLKSPTCRLSDGFIEDNGVESIAPKKQSRPCTRVSAQIPRFVRRTADMHHAPPRSFFKSRQRFGARQDVSV